MTDGHHSSNWHRSIESQFECSPEMADRLWTDGFVVISGPATAGGQAELAAAYDRAVSTADPTDVSVRSSTRVLDFVNRGPEFDCLYIHPPLLAACCHIIGQPFKLSTLLARTLEPWTTAQPLHVDVSWQAEGWPLVGFILMIDDFTPINGATRFVPGTHRLTNGPDARETNPAGALHEVLACGTAGSMLIYHGSVWHGHSTNASPARRRSIQGAFIPREARAALDHAARLRPETAARIGSLAKYLLGLEADGS